MTKTVESALLEFMQQENRSLSVTLLEAAVACGGSGIEDDLLAYISARYGREEVEAVCREFKREGILTEEASALLPSSLPAVTKVLGQLVGGMELRLGNEVETAQDFLEQFIEYLKVRVPGLVTLRSPAPGNRMFQWEGGKYVICLAFSPFWLPAVAERMAREECYLAAIGPFAAQKWENLYPFYEQPEFRDQIACFDPWSNRKMNISKGGLFAFLDWFFRDAFQKRFLIEDSFKLALHELGLMRFDDER